jgi:hypothetical protein
LLRRGQADRGDKGRDGFFPFTTFEGQDDTGRIERSV